jgi:hypothetical protein
MGQTDNPIAHNEGNLPVIFAPKKHLAVNPDLYQKCNVSAPNSRFNFGDPNAIPFFEMS